MTVIGLKIEINEPKGFICNSICRRYLAISIFSSYLFIPASYLVLPAETNVSLKMATCLALGEIGRSSSLLLPAGGEGDGKGETTKLSVISSLLKMLKASSEPNKVIFKK